MFSKIFKSKEQIKEVSQAEAVFPQIVDLVKDLDKQAFKRLMTAIQSVYDAYYGLRDVKTRDEKEAKPVDLIEKDLLGSFAEQETEKK